jgi:hypothetical protein
VCCAAKLGVGKRNRTVNEIIGSEKPESELSAANIKIGVFENNTTNAMNATFARYTGGKSKTVKVKANETLSIDYSLQTKDGTISFVVAKDGETLFTAANGSCLVLERVRNC